MKIQIWIDNPGFVWYNTILNSSNQINWITLNNKLSQIWLLKAGTGSKCANAVRFLVQNELRASKLKVWQGCTADRQPSNLPLRWLFLGIRCLFLDIRLFISRKLGEYSSEFLSTLLTILVTGLLVRKGPIETKHKSWYWALNRTFYWHIAV